MYDEDKDTIDMAEVWRQNYMDALDEIRNLRLEIYELKIENKLLKKDIDRAENHIYNYNEGSTTDFLG